MNILVAYATNSGGTADAANIVSTALTSGNHQVTTKMIHDVAPDDLAAFDLILFGSPSWDYQDKEGVPHEDFIAFMEKMKGLPAGRQGKTLPNKNVAIFGLGDSSYTHFCGAVDHLEEFVKTLQGKLMSESLRIDGYYTHPGNQEKVKEWAEHLLQALTK